MLERFGFTPTEARVYEALLRSGPSTGYAIARDLGIARANVYQALESLHRRSAARKSATSPARYSATGPAAIVSELERSFRSDLDDLERLLSELPLAAGKALELEQLRTPDQLVARAAACADSARSELLAVTGPWAARANGRIAAAAARHLSVKAVALGEMDLAGAVARSVPLEKLEAYWGGLPLAVVADRERAVVGVLTSSGGGGIATTMPGVVPFIRNVIRRELSAGS